MSQWEYFKISSLLYANFVSKLISDTLKEITANWFKIKSHSTCRSGYLEKVAKGLDLSDNGP